MYRIVVNLDSQESNPLSFQQCNMSVHVDKSALLVRLNKKNAGEKK